MLNQPILFDLMKCFEIFPFESLSREMYHDYQIHIPMGEKFEFTRHDLGDYWFKQDVFVFLVGEDQDARILIGGERQLLEGVPETAYFITNSIASWTENTEFVKNKDDSAAETIHMIHLDCQNPNPVALKFLLTHLPKVDPSRDYLEISKGDNWFVVGNDSDAKPVHICLQSSKKLRLRKSKKHPDEWRLAVIEDKSFAGGGYSDVYKNLSTFRLDADQAAITTTKPRVYKFFWANSSGACQHSDYRYSPARIAQQIALEGDILRLMPYLKSTKIQEDKITKNSYAHFEALLPGTTLSDWVLTRYFLKQKVLDQPLKEISADQAQNFVANAAFDLVIVKPLIEPCSVQQRVALCIALVDALLVVHSKGVVHCDVKPDNLMVLNKDNQFSACAIDFNLSRYAADHSVNADDTGTPRYWSPESMENKYFQYGSDVYSLGIVLGLVFGATLLHLKSRDQIKSLLVTGYRFEGLFNNVPDLTLMQRNHISNILYSMVRLDPKARPSLGGVREAFQYLLTPAPAASDEVENSARQRPGL